MEITPAMVTTDLGRRLKSADADDAYNIMRSTARGKILGTDLAREVSVYYRTFDQRVAFTGATLRPASEYIIDRLMRDARRPGPAGRTALLLAGGPGSGKSFGIRSADVREFDMIFDSTFANIERTRQVIGTLCEEKWHVIVKYTHRPYYLAVPSMLQRAIDTGRYVTVGGSRSQMAEMHIAAQRNVVAICKEFDAKIECAAIANLYEPGKSSVDTAPHEIDIGELDIDGPYYYADAERLHAHDFTNLYEFTRKYPDKSKLFDAISSEEWV